MMFALGIVQNLSDDPFSYLEAIRSKLFPIFLSFRDRHKTFAVNLFWSERE